MIILNQWGEKMKIHLLKQAALDLLTKDIDQNYKKYKSDENWLNDYFNNNGIIEYSFDSGIEVEDIDLSIGDEKTDLDNIKKVYESLKDKINLLQATDLRLWAYMTHETFWKYMRTRWPLEEYDKKTRIENRYFFDRAPYVRNGISRLFWTGYMTYDPDNKDNHYEYTEFVLSDQDIMVASLERQIGRSKNLILGNLQALLEAKKDESGFSREDIRDFYVRLNQQGGVSLLDSYSREEALAMSRQIVKDIKELPSIDEGKLVTVRFVMNGNLAKYRINNGKLYLSNVFQKSEPINVIGRKQGRTIKIHGDEAIILNIE